MLLVLFHIMCAYFSVLVFNYVHHTTLFNHKGVSMGMLNSLCDKDIEYFMRVYLSVIVSVKCASYYAGI